MLILLPPKTIRFSELYSVRNLPKKLSYSLGVSTLITLLGGASLLALTSCSTSPFEYRISYENSMAEYSEEYFLKTLARLLELKLLSGHLILFALPT